MSSAGVSSALVALDPTAEVALASARELAVRSGASPTAGPAFSCVASGCVSDSSISSSGGSDAGSSMNTTSSALSGTEPGCDAALGRSSTGVRGATRGSFAGGARPAARVLASNSSAGVVWSSNDGTSGASGGLWGTGPPGGRVPGAKVGMPSTVRERFARFGGGGTWLVGTVAGFARRGRAGGLAHVSAALTEPEPRRAPGGNGIFKADSDGRVPGGVESLRGPLKLGPLRTEVACERWGEAAGAADALEGDAADELKAADALEGDAADEGDAAGAFVADAVEAEEEGGSGWALTTEASLGTRGRVPSTRIFA